MPGSNADRAGGRRMAARRADANRTDVRVEHLDARPSSEGAARCADVDERHVEVVVERAGGCEPSPGQRRGDASGNAAARRSRWRCAQSPSPRSGPARRIQIGSAASGGPVERACPRAAQSVRACTSSHTGNPPPGPVPSTHAFAATAPRPQPPRPAAPRRRSPNPPRRRDPTSTSRAPGQMREHRGGLKQRTDTPVASMARRVAMAVRRTR